MEQDHPECAPILELALLRATRTRTAISAATNCIRITQAISRQCSMRASTALQQCAVKVKHCQSTSTAMKHTRIQRRSSMPSYRDCHSVLHICSSNKHS